MNDLCRNAASHLAQRLSNKAGEFLFILFVLLMPLTSSAQQFTATALGDYGNVTVMEVTGNYNTYNADGTVNALSRQVIANEFFKSHKDKYDYLVIFTNFDFKMPVEKEGPALGFYTGVISDTQGIGKAPNELKWTNAVIC